MAGDIMTGLSTADSNWRPIARRTDVGGRTVWHLIPGTELSIYAAHWQAAFGLIELTNRRCLDKVELVVRQKTTPASQVTTQRERMAILPNGMQCRRQSDGSAQEQQK
jgi:hypothetical protein